MQCEMHVGRMNLHLFMLHFFVVVVAVVVVIPFVLFRSIRGAITMSARYTQSMDWVAVAGFNEIAKIAFIMRAIAHIVRCMCGHFVTF